MLRILSLTAYPLLVVAAYYLVCAFTSDSKGDRTEWIDNTLILTGFAMALADLKDRNAKTPLKRVRRTLSILIALTAVNVVVIVLLLVKVGFASKNSILLGELSITVGLLTQIKSIARLARDLESRSTTSVQEPIDLN